ncbi:MAG: hypothetical protein V7K48_05705 [Nostoc sp.]
MCMILRKVIKSSITGSTYEEVQLWLLEDEYEPIEGRISASEV